MKRIIKAVVLQNRKLEDGIFDMCLSAPEIASEVKAGQFVNLYTGKGELLLPRPISICEYDKEKETLRLVYQVVGKGTALFSNLQTGDSIKVLGPLGNGFSYTKSPQNHVLIGGGIGVPPMLQLAKELNGEVQVFIGAKSRPILTQDFQNYGVSVSVATDDGSVGFHGNVVSLLRTCAIQPSQVYACGPTPMLRAVASWAHEKQLCAQLSMEERMACGIGACVGCAVKIQREGAQDWQYLKVCKDGPVFLSSEVVWDA